MTVMIRRATEADIDAIRDIAHHAWHATYESHLRPATIDAFLAGPYSRDTVARRIRDGQFLLALDADARPVAYADAVLRGDHILLGALYARPDERGRGAGTTLLDAVAALDPELPIDAWVLTGNRRGERFYERRGFRPVESSEGELFGERVHERRWRRPPRNDGPQTVHIRAATVADASAIARIYNEGIEDRIATLETTLRGADERAQWLASRSPRHPVLVATDDTATAIGWASLNPFNARAAYDQVADISVYVERDRRGRGLGAVLLAALEDEARGFGFHKLVLAALARNERGRRLYETMGFRDVGTYREQGQLDGEWVDVVVMEKLLR